MRSAPGGLAPFDFAILREMYRTGAVTIAGVDPRRNVSRIAATLKVSRARVAARLRAWEESGLLRRFDVVPNPALFDLVGVTVDVRIAHRLQKAQVFEQLGHLDGAVGAFEMIGEWLSVQLVAPDEATWRRRVQLIRGLAGVIEVGEPNRWERLEPRRPITDLDRRILAAVRAAPAATLDQIARTVKVSTRTVTTRYRFLVETWGVWFFPIFDFTRLPTPIVQLVVVLAPGAPKAPVLAAIRAAYPESLEFGQLEHGPQLAPGAHVFFVSLPSAAATEELERTAGALPGVVEVEALVFVRMHSYPAFFDQLLATPVRGGTPPALPRPPARGPSRRSGYRGAG